MPWRTEAEVYRSDLADRLPDGLTMPRALDVVDLDELSAAIWIEEVPVREVAVGPRAVPARGVPARAARGQSRGGTAGGAARRGRGTSSPTRAAASRWTWSRCCAGDEVWQHPLCAAFDDDLRDRLRAAAARHLDLALEGDALPRLTSHGDACPNNLLAGENDDDLVLIDFGFWGAAPVGFDLQTLLVGDVQIGRRSAATLAEVDEAIIPAYVEGLRAEGCDIAEDVVRRAHAVRSMLMTGLSTVPVDLFEVADDRGGPADRGRPGRDRPLLPRPAGRDSYLSSRPG